LKRDWDPGDVDRLARLAAEGDEDAFDTLVRLVFRRIHRWAVVRLGDDDDATDVTQRVLIRLHAGLGSWEGTGRFTTWLYRITANEASSWSRRASRRAAWLRPFSRPWADKLETDGSSGWASTGQRDIDQDRLIALVRTYFEDLPPRQREVLDLVDFQGFAPRETAEMLQMNPSTVRANLLKARRSLRQRILEVRPDALDLLP